MRQEKLLPLFLAFAYFVSGKPESLYCAFHPNHSLCVFNGFGPNCGETIYASGVDQGDINLILHFHNTMRSYVATGQETEGLRGPQPKASNMLAIKWDKELAKTAQSYANQCIVAHDCFGCRVTKNYDCVGQNLYWMAYHWNYSHSGKWFHALYKFYREVEDFDSAYIHRCCQKSSPHVKIGHYTQMMWADVNSVGCGYTKYKTTVHAVELFAEIYICNYGTCGNVRDWPMYTVGEPCSKCPTGTACSSVYLGLCEKVSGTYAIAETRVAKSPSGNRNSHYCIIIFILMYI